MISIGTNGRLLILEVWEYFLSIETKVMMITAALKQKKHDYTVEVRTKKGTVGAGWWRDRGFRMPR